MAYIISVKGNPSQWTINPETGNEYSLPTLTCVHCDLSFIVRPGSGIVRGFCSCCNGPTCGRFKCQPCYPFMKKVEEVEKGRRRLEDL